MKHTKTEVLNIIKQQDDTLKENWRTMKPIYKQMFNRKFKQFVKEATQWEQKQDNTTFINLMN